MKTNLLKYHILNVLIFIGLFSLIVPCIYYTWTGNGYSHLFDINRDKNNPNSKRKIASFFKTW